jgi:glutamyl-tRNA synthetase
MSSAPLSEVIELVRPFREGAGAPDPDGLSADDRRRFEAAIELHRQRARDLRQLAEVVAPYFQDEIEYDSEATETYRSDPELPELLDALRESYRSVEPFEIDPLDQALRALAEEREVKAGRLIHPLRMALSGQKAGPPVFDLVAVMGRERTDHHLARFQEHLKTG